MSGCAAAELTVEGLTIRFGGLTAVDDLSFEVREGEVLSLIGPNGAGKTTAFNAITGYIEPAGGEIRYRGARLTGLEPTRDCRAAAWCARSRRPACSPARRAHDNVLIGLHLRSRQRPLAILARPAVGGARGGASWRARPREILALRRAGGARTRRRLPRCPTASCACSRSRSRWRRGRSCCCSTSRCPA